ncbi:MAG: hypothetical protein ACE5H2_08645 [Terriglobia bacterium]
MELPTKSQRMPARVMSELVEPFAVHSRLTGESYRVRFSHLWVAISTRHSDTVDCKFLVNGRGVIVGLAHLGYVAFRERTGRQLSDPEAAALAAAYLRDCLEDDRLGDRTLLYVSPEEVVGWAARLGYVAAR